MTALVSGSPERVREAGVALEQAGFEVLRAPHPERVHELCRGLGSEALDYYIQLPNRIATRKGAVVEQVGDFLTQGLFARFAAAAAVLPTLRCGATVMLVAGHQASGEIADDRPARRDLLAVLARAIAWDIAVLGGRTIVAGPDLSPGALAEVARSRGAIRAPDLSTCTVAVPEMTHDEWRREAFSLPRVDVHVWGTEPSPDDYDW